MRGATYISVPGIGAGFSRKKVGSINQASRQDSIEQYLDTPFAKIRISFEALHGGGRRLSIVGPRGKYRYSKYYTTSGLE